MVTGTSVVGVTFADGVMLAADTLGESNYFEWWSRDSLNHCVQMDCLT